MLWGSVSGYGERRPAGLRSPRGRGSHPVEAGSSVIEGSIPAWAGEPRRPSPWCATARVYPRVGGGARIGIPLYSEDTGLSPRGRGSRNPPRDPVELAGSIPAWAGEPSWSPPAATRCRVYPRVGGGAAHADPVGGAVRGLSPRGRGSHLDGDSDPNRAESIPAWAGEPRFRRRSAGRTGVYPRVGGGAVLKSPLSSPSMGLSPRGRGSRAGAALAVARRGSIPAWAGEPAAHPGRRPLRTVYPRVGGGAQGGRASGGVNTGLSPRGRGSQAWPFDPGALAGSIPAWAGEPGRKASIHPSPGVYPRVGGGARRPVIVSLSVV